MCLMIYIGSKNPLPIIDGSEFYISEEDNTDKSYPFVKQLLSANFLYSPSSFFGCSCGFSYGAWSETDDDHPLRIKAVSGLLEYLRSNSKDNELKIFCTWWDKFPDAYEIKEFDLNSVSNIEFNFEENIILTVYN